MQFEANKKTITMVDVDPFQKWIVYLQTPQLVEMTQFEPHVDGKKMASKIFENINYTNYTNYSCHFVGIFN